ncbi:MAG: PAS domain-containing protein [Elusimicrobia bacterium]|nr:PAS domain-containing protein [Elusimicrobiota bacterium]
MPAPLLFGIPGRRPRDRSLGRLLDGARDTSPDGVLIVDADGRIASFNRRFVRLWGIPRRLIAEKSDRKALQYVLDKLVDPQGFRARVQYLYKNRRERSREEIALRDGRTFERHSAPIFSATGEYFGRVWYFRDITERIESEARRRESERLKRHQELLASVSHDLPTPLTAIEGFTETLLNGALNDARNRTRFLKTIFNQSRRLRSLVDGLLEMSQVEAGSGRPQPVRLDLSRFARDFAAGMQPIFRRKRMRLRLSVPAGIFVAVEESTLSRVVGNLLDNAVKYGFPGSTVRLSAARDGRRVRVTVSDRGIGIAPKELGKVFERFHRSEAARRHGIAGHGLGLYMVKKLIERAGGRIRVESREGKGSSFIFALPHAG